MADRQVEAEPKTCALPGCDNPVMVGPSGPSLYCSVRHKRIVKDARRRLNRRTP